MNIAPHILTIYQQLLVLSQTMLRLATEGSWEELIEMEVVYVSAVEKLAESTKQNPIPAQVQDQLRPVLRHILDNEAEVKNLLQARMTELSSLIGQASRQKSVNKAYTRVQGMVLFAHGPGGI
ncbi:flagella biosynthesis regulatory protein FliT [Erwinia tracheiphila]|uniref:Flagellar protein FliT n=1 Tax=Erwinia tracheiphila TaxID=65700 RepID=A0A345CQ66_9GAMM|nr:flagella biosynthesis regulatory protein FliT [Erwinia tracheiphila]AXF75583.1 flagella biosynthesis regulatory protein FliT [Erwinia tracheiphila]UIA81869.1 flagella biosynthesis regulatory protein FliT [Erwinia tracheiphila]UIA90465.1 flagella biosynthesis regulatory protein FliT [Erwinia tracheiphila]